MIDLPDRDMLVSWKRAPNLAALILSVWQYVAQCSPSDRDASDTRQPSLRAQLEVATCIDDGGSAVGGAVDALLATWPHDLGEHPQQIEAIGILLAFLGVMDEIFLSVHPRTVRLPPGLTSHLPIPEWLQRLEFTRTRDGWYAANDRSYLIPRGPLLRVARDPIASYADNLADRFSAIGVCDRHMAEGQRSIAITMCPVGSDAARGVPHPDKPGHERVGFVAVAEAENDLDVHIEERHGRDYVDFRPRPDLEVADRILEAARAIQQVDLLVCPELTVGAQDTAKLCSLLQGSARKFANVMLAGSGLSTETHADNRHWNEARLINGAGVILAKQRKVWPFGLARLRAESYKLQLTPGSISDLIMEDVASGSEVTVIDLTGFGRLVILICQDFESHPLASNIIQQYQPDWVLVPILDHSIRDHGWTNNRSFALSGLSQARFVVSNSLSLFRRAQGPDAEAPAIGLAVGPRDPTKDFDGSDIETRRALAFAKMTIHRSPYHSVLTWRDPASQWLQFELTGKA